jgi:hypothetical protein
MTLLASRLLDFVDERLDDMLEAPEMWGSGESVELQILQLLEIRALVLEPTPEVGWRSVQASYERYLATRFPGAPPTTLAALLGKHQDQLTTILRGFVESQRSAFPRSSSERNADEIRSVERLLELGRLAAERETKRRDTYGERLVELAERSRR